MCFFLPMKSPRLIFTPFGKVNRVNKKAISSFCEEIAFDFLFACYDITFVRSSL